MCLDADDYCPYEEERTRREAEAGWEEFQYGMKKSLRVVGYGLLLELAPETVVWKTANGEIWTARAMQEQISQETEVAEQYISEVMRVARDFLARRANAKV